MPLDTKEVLRLLRVEQVRQESLRALLAQLMVDADQSALAFATMIRELQAIEKSPSTGAGSMLSGFTLFQKREEARRLYKEQCDAQELLATKIYKTLAADGKLTYRAHQYPNEPIVMKPEELS